MLFTAFRPAPELREIAFQSPHAEQVELNAYIAARYNSAEEEAKERILDAIQFASWMSPNLPGVKLLVTPAPVVEIKGDDAEGSFGIQILHGSANFSVKGSPFMDMGSSVQERISTGKKLLSSWETLIKHLPEGFIIYGPDVDRDHPTFHSREKVLQWLGFAPCEANGDRFGIVREGKVTPLTRFEFEQLTGQEGVEILYNQRFMTERIVWPGEEI
jgi:hypothetical protein